MNTFPIGTTEWEVTCTMQNTVQQAGDKYRQCKAFKLEIAGLHSNAASTEDCHNTCTKVHPDFPGSHSDNGLTLCLHASKL